MWTDWIMTSGNLLQITKRATLLEKSPIAVAIFGVRPVLCQILKTQSLLGFGTSAFFRNDQHSSPKHWTTLYSRPMECIQGTLLPL